VAVLTSSARTLWRRSFAGHPVRISAAATAVVAAAAIAWYLGSPLFLTTYRDEAVPTVAAPGATGATPGAGVPVRTLASGELRTVDSLHSGTGPVKLVEVGGRHFVRFENVAIQNGPDLHVYLSPDTGGRYVDATSLYLGSLKATNGSFNYEIPSGTDLSPYRSVVVWCRAFAVLFTWADLAAP
jgi:hypothetical protein